MKSIMFCSVVLLCLGRACAQQPALATETAQTLGAGRVVVGIGAEFFSKKYLPTSDVPKSEWRVATIAARLGIADNVNFDIEWRGGLIARDENDNQLYDWGDVTVATKIHILDEHESVPSVGLRSAVKLPNTSYLPYKLGSDQTDYYAQLLLTKNRGNAEFRFNVGFGIVGNPQKLGWQDDIYIASAAAIVRVHETFRSFVELYGFTGSLVDGKKLLARLGAIAELLELEWNFFGAVRLAGSAVDIGTAFEASEDWSAGIFISKDLRF